MQLKLKFETIEDIKELSPKIQAVKLQLLQFQIATVERIAITLTLAIIHNKMRAAGFSQKIIDGTTLAFIEIRSPKRVRLHFKSEYFSITAFDVALGREEGTERHFIEPISIGTLFEGPKALHWDEDKFSKGHFVDGIVALFIVANTVDETEEQFQDEYNRILAEWFAANLGGSVIAS